MHLNAQFIFSAKMAQKDCYVFRVKSKLKCFVSCWFHSLWVFFPHFITIIQKTHILTNDKCISDEIRDFI